MDCKEDVMQTLGHVVPSPYPSPAMREREAATQRKRSAAGEGGGFSHPQLTHMFEIKSLGTDGTFAGYASVFDVVDSQRDVVRRGAFRKSLRERTQPVQLLWQHKWDAPIGVIEQLFEDGRGLYIRGRLLMEVAQAREAYSLLKSGVVKGLSIGYRVKNAVQHKALDIRYLLEVDLWEVSLVTHPANAAAQVTVVKQLSPETQIKMLRDAEAFAEHALRGLMKQYNPNQPRAPRGSSNGGQWTSGGGGGGGSLSRTKPLGVGKPSASGGRSIGRINPSLGGGLVADRAEGSTPGISFNPNANIGRTSGGVFSTVPVRSGGGGQPMAFSAPKGNMSRSVEVLRSRAHTKPQGYCAQYVREALNSGGYTVRKLDRSPAYAKDYGPNLEEAGFEPVASSQRINRRPAVYPLEGYRPQVGDVVVMDTYPTSKNQAGHMAMYDGDSWISDFKQPNFWPGRDYREYGSEYTIYRYPNVRVEP